MSLPLVASSFRRFVAEGLVDGGRSGESGICMAVSAELLCDGEALLELAAVDFRLAVFRPERNAYHLMSHCRASNKFESESHLAWFLQVVQNPRHHQRPFPSSC